MGAEGRQMDALIGNILGTYHIQAEIGRGGMGIVYYATRLSDGSPVALKVLVPRLSRDPAFVRRFWDEYRTVRVLYHRNIVRVYEFGQDGGRYFIAVEYIAGASLEQRLAGRHDLPPHRGDRGGVSLPETINIVQQIAAALDAVHPRGIVHRDLKPSNILIEHGGRVMLTDFGIASIGGGRGRQAQQGAWWGTPEYMSPEQARGDPHITFRSDIYALGVVTYEMLSGYVPFRRDMPLATLHAHIHETPPPLRSIPGRRHIPVSAERVVMQALQKDPARRPPTAGAFARQLAAAGRGVRVPGRRLRRQPTPLPRPRTPPGPTPPPSRTPAPRPASFPRPLLIGLALLGVMLLTVAVLALSRSSGTYITSGTLAYVSQQGEETHICVQDDAGRQQTFICGTRDWAPAWSPDGQYIVFASEQGGSTDLWVLRPENGHASLFTPGGQGEVSSPAWSSDGQRIVFDAKSTGENYDVYVQQIGDSVPTRLTGNSTRDSDPAWSPDGQHIGFVSDREDSDLEIYTMDAWGQKVTRLTYHAGWDFAPVWSPGGEQIAYECTDDAGGDIEICIMDAGGYNHRMLTSNAVDDRQPAWSPDGQHIAFCRKRAGGSVWDIWVMDADGTNQQIWIQDGYSNTHPVWKP